MSFKIFWIRASFVALFLSTMVYITNASGSFVGDPYKAMNEVPQPDKDIHPLAAIYDKSDFYSNFKDVRNDISVNEIVYIDDKFISPPGGIIRSANPFTVKQSYKPDNYKKQLSCFVEALYFEARGVDYENVANVILNRVDKKRFPGSICGVVHQSGQFSYYGDDNIDKSSFFERTKHKEIARFAHNMLKSKTRNDTTSGALFYYNPTIVKGIPNWANLSTFTVYDGAHVFMVDDYKLHELAKMNENIKLNKKEV